jgi:beta-lactam-binding protein with PASTA domain
MALLLAGAVFGLFVWGTRAPRDATVPYLTGQTRAQAEERLAGRGLAMRVIKEEYDDKPAGTVLIQDPPGGNQLKQGKPVDVWISKGPEPATVPNLVAMSEADARARLREASLSVGSVQQQYDEIEPKGTVISQEPPAGTETAKKSPVSFVVSRGPEPLPPPVPDSEPEPAPPPPFEGALPDGSPPDGGTTDDTNDDSGTLTVPLDASGSTGQTQLPSERVFDIDTKLEGTKGWSRVRIVVDDDRPRREVVNQLYRRGQTVTNTIKAIGAPGSVRITVYVNGKIARDIRF